MNVNGRAVPTAAALAAALASDWDASTALLITDQAARSFLDTWRQDQHETSLASVIVELQGHSPEYRVARLISRADPMRPPEYRGRILSHDELARLAAAVADATADRPPALGGFTRPELDAELLDEIFEHHLLAAYATTRGFESFGEIDTDWHREVEAATGAPEILLPHGRSIAAPELALARSVLLLDQLGRAACPLGHAECVSGRWLGALARRPSGFGPGAYLAHVTMTIRAKDLFDDQDRSHRPLSDDNYDLRNQIDRHRERIAELERELAGTEAELDEQTALARTAYEQRARAEEERSSAQQDASRRITEERRRVDAGFVELRNLLAVVAAAYVAVLVLGIVWGFVPAAILTVIGVGAWIYVRREELQRLARSSRR